MSRIVLMVMVMVLPQVFMADPNATYPNVTYTPHRVIPSSSIVFIKEKHGNLTFRESIKELISAMEQTMIEDHVMYLSGEDPRSSLNDRVSTGINSPNSINQAIAYVELMMMNYGFEVEAHEYRDDYGPNVISTLRGTSLPNELVILGAHLDDRPYTGRAPGANDDGSGSSALLSMAETIHNQKSSFKRTLVFEHYTGEEQGLRGSRAIAAKRSADGDDVKAQIQQDMTAVQLSGDPVGLAFVRDANAVDLTLTDYVQKVAEQYKDDELTLYDRVLSGSSCCSDHQSYKENGFASVGLIEPRGYTGDPQYHRVGDVVDRAEFNTLQATLSARVVLAAAADLAELNS